LISPLTCICSDPPPPSLEKAARYARLGPGVVEELIAAPRGQDTLHWGECEHNRSPLHEAVWYGHSSIVRVLLEANADPNLVENDYISPLHFGAYGHDDSGGAQRRNNMIRMVATRKTITNDADKDNVKKHNDNDIAEVEAKDRRDDTKVDKRNNNDDEDMKQTERLLVLQLLLDSGRCRVNQGERHGCTALWYAAGGGWPGAVEALLNAGAIVDPVLSHLPAGRQGTRSSTATTASPLMRALYCGNYATAKLLLARGASVVESIWPRLDTLQVPNDLVEALRARAAAAATATAAAGNTVLDDYTDSQELSAPCKDNETISCVGYEMTTKCFPVPIDAFAIPPAAAPRYSSS
jgi:Ankyrin repeats (many copies)/Ankyrin repeats (3 copies)